MDRAAPGCGRPANRLIARATVFEPGGANPWVTPFSRWAFHRAWWDGYGGNAHEETVVFVEAGASDDAAPVAIAPLMHRHELEPCG